MRVTLIQADTVAVIAGDERTFELRPNCYTVGTLDASLLAGLEEVDIYKANGTGWKALTDKDGNVQKLTATVNHIVIDAPGLYGVLKDATAGSCAVSVDLG